jgi:hypothetical protein
MTSRWLWAGICAALALLLLGAGLLVPAHLRAVDASVVRSAGRTGDSLPQRGRQLLESGRPGAAYLYALALQRVGMAGWDRLGESISNSAARNPAAYFWGNDRRVENFFAGRAGEGTFSAFIVQRENREAALAHLAQSPSGAVLDLLHCRGLERTVLLPPSSSPAGQAFDTVLAESGLLLEGGHLTSTMIAGLRDQIDQALQDGNSGPLEQTLVDFGSLGEHLNWDQLSALVVRVSDAKALHALAVLVARAGERLPVWFVAVQLSGAPAAVTAYQTRFPETGFKDISAALWYGGQGVKELTESGRRLYAAEAARWVATHSPLGAVYYFAAARSLQNPGLMLAAKLLLYLGAGFFLAAALYFSRPPVSPLEQALRVRGFRALRGGLIALGFLLLTLILSEPFLAQESQRGEASPGLRLPTAGGAAPQGVAGIKQTVMDQFNNPIVWLTLLVFFVLQGLIYLSCRLKLAEVQRQPVLPRIKLKLLENEEHLFDAGLYLGFVGTILSLILSSLHEVQFSLMAAYSSTCFGIIFVIVFKIFHLRPARRKLLLESELADVSGATPAVRPPTASTPAPTA